MSWLRYRIQKEAIGLADAGHMALDVGGLVPGIGEAADLTNAAWYAGQGSYLNAAFSLISMIPVVGDIIGKGGKAGVWLTKKFPKGSAQFAKWAPQVTKAKGVTDEYVKGYEEFSKFGPQAQRFLSKYAPGLLGLWA